MHYLMHLTGLRLLLAALCLSSAGGSAQAKRQGSARQVAIDMVVIHSTGGPTCDANGRLIWVKSGELQANLRFIEAHPKLGIHYMIDRDGTLRASVPEDQVAHHVFRYSERSIAVELINDGDGADPFPAPQLNALVTLLRDIRQRRGITREGVKRHSDLDTAALSCEPRQRRKVDPGEAFPFDDTLNLVFPAR
jgi:N-acetylmuramoyl-L-alanine amidase